MGFVAVGYAPATELTEEPERYMHSLESGHFANMEYLKRNLEKRFNPQLLVEGAMSVLVFLAPYGKQRDSQYIELFSSEQDATLKYKVAQYALGEDYHTVIRAKLNAVLEMMKEADPHISGRIFVDTAPVLERAWAVRAGLGFIGKNNFFISREFGIRNFIGVIVSNYETEEPVNVAQTNGSGETKLSGREEKEIGKKYCGTCMKCIENCPTGALCAPYTLDARKCTSYLTIEEKGASFGSNMEHAGERGDWIFGCDACMDACPWNSRNTKGWKEFEQKRTPLESSHLRRR